MRTGHRSLSGSVKLLGIIPLMTMLVFCNFHPVNRKVVGNGEKSVRKVTVGDYDGIEAKGILTVRLVPGREGEIRVITDQNLQPYVKVALHEGVLSIGIRDHINYESDLGITVVVPYERLSSVSGKGITHIETADDAVIRSDGSFRLAMLGMGRARLHVEAPQVKVRLQGAADITLTGKTDRLTIQHMGLGRFNGLAMEARSVEAAMTGAGKAQVWARDSLKARVQGMGKLRYKGRPAHVDIHKSGLGTVTSL